MRDASFNPAMSFWRAVGAAPHRPMFLAGAVQLVLIMVWWLAELAGRLQLIPSLPPLVLAPMWMHVFFMIFGLFPFFIFGFLFTVYPRWMRGHIVPPSHYLATFALTTTGIILAYIGMFTTRHILTIALALYLSGWVSGMLALWLVYLHARTRSNYEALLNVALTLGALGIFAFAYGVLTNDLYGFFAARQIGLWGFLVPVLLIVSHRMIPFFTHSALPFMNMVRPAWGLWTLVIGSALHGVFDATGLVGLRLVVDVTLAVTGVYHSWLWGFRRSMRVRLLAMLHIAFLWFGITMMLYAIDAGLVLMGMRALGRAPMHALGIGFVTSTLIAMATRVTLGHSGRPLVATGLPWYGLFGIYVVAITRMLAEVIPGAYQTLNVIAAAGWIVCILPWVWHYAPIYVRPRVDNQPG